MQDYLRSVTKAKKPDLKVYNSYVVLSIPAGLY